MKELTGPSGPHSSALPPIHLPCQGGCRQEPTAKHALTGLCEVASPKWTRKEFTWEPQIQTKASLVPNQEVPLASS